MIEICIGALRVESVSVRVITTAVSRAGEKRAAAGVKVWNSMIVTPSRTS